MKHDFIDKYAFLDSPLHRLDPRLKLLCTFCFILTFILTDNIINFVYYFLVLFLLISLSKVPVLYYLKRALLITPFTLVLAAFMILSSLFFETNPPAGIYERVTLIALKSYTSIFMLSILTSVTRFNCLLWGLQKFKFPLVITTISKLVYTYIFLLIDELQATMRSVKSRAPHIKKGKIKLYGNICASILQKSISRSEMIYHAMESRKFRGEFFEGSSNKFKSIDLFACAAFLVINTPVILLWTL